MDAELFPSIPVPHGNHDSQVMSALIKCTRLRRVDDAVFWFTYFVKAWPKDKFRVSKRILIMAGEDCIDPPVQMAVADWFWKALNNKDMKTWYSGAVAMLHLIAATDDWWKSSSGSGYIASFGRCEKMLSGIETEAKKYLLNHPLPHKPHNLAMCAHMIKHGAWRKKEQAAEKKTYVESLVNDARVSGNLAARVPAAIHYRFAQFLTGDDNYIGQTVYRLAFGPLGKMEYPKIDPLKVKESVNAALTRLKTTNVEKAPKWVQDGIHCYGKDRRFAGILPSMVACCRAYREYGRLHPDDPHPPAFSDPEALIKILRNEGGLSWE